MGDLPSSQAAPVETTLKLSPVLQKLLIDSKQRIQFQAQCSIKWFWADVIGNKSIIPHWTKVHTCGRIVNACWAKSVWTWTNFVECREKRNAAIKFSAFEFDIRIACQLNCWKFYPSQEMKLNETQNEKCKSWKYFKGL